MHFRREYRNLVYPVYLCMRAHTQHETSASCTETCNDFFFTIARLGCGKMLNGKCRIVYRLEADSIKKEEEADNTSVDNIVRRAYPCPHFF